MTRARIMLLTRDGLYVVQTHFYDKPHAEYRRPIYPTVPVAMKDIQEDVQYAAIQHRRYVFSGWISEAGVELPLYQEVAE